MNAWRKASAGEAGSIEEKIMDILLKLKRVRASHNVMMLQSIILCWSIGIIFLSRNELWALLDTR
jgi:hypothetical protein